MGKLTQMTVPLAKGEQITEEKKIYPITTPQAVVDSTGKTQTDWNNQTIQNSTDINNLKKVSEVEVNDTGVVPTNPSTELYIDLKAQPSDTNMFEPKGGYNRKLYESAGAKWNPKTGFYELNGLTDITEEQMRTILLLSIYRGSSSSISDNSVRAIINPSNITQGDIMHFSLNTGAFYLCSNIEVIDFGANSIIESNSITFAFAGCKKLKKIIGKIRVNNIYSFIGTFSECSSLEKIKILGLIKDISFDKSPLLDVSDDDQNGSLAYMIANSGNETGVGTGVFNPITITLHPDALKKVVPALQAKAEARNITLASA